MIHSSVLSRNPGYGTTAMWHYDDVTGEAHVVTHTDVGAMMTRNQEEFKNWNDCSRMGDLVKCCSIPLAKYFRLKKEGIIDDLDPRQIKFWRWARENYAEYQKWFTVPKKVLF